MTEPAEHTRSQFQVMITIGRSCLARAVGRADAVPAIAAMHSANASPALTVRLRFIRSSSDLGKWLGSELGRSLPHKAVRGVNES